MTMIINFKKLDVVNHNGKDIGLNKARKKWGRFIVGGKKTFQPTVGTSEINDSIPTFLSKMNFYEAQ